MFGQAVIKFGLLLGGEDEFGRAFGVCETLPQGHGDLNTLADGKLEKLSKGARQHVLNLPRPGPADKTRR